MKRVQFHLTIDQIARLRGLAKHTGLSVAELVRRAVDLLLGRDDRIDRKALRAARKEPGSIPWKQVKEELGLGSEE